MTEKVEIAFCRRATFEETKDALAALMCGKAQFGAEIAVAQRNGQDRTEHLRLGHEIGPRSVRTFVVAELDVKQSLGGMVSAFDDARATWRVWLEGDEPEKAAERTDRNRVPTETETRQSAAAPRVDRRPWWQRMTQA